MILSTKEAQSEDGSDLHMFSRSGKTSTSNHLAFARHMKKIKPEFGEVKNDTFDESFKIVSDVEAFAIAAGEKPFDLKRVM